jgi:Fuc2NAc and GlcNAc transferase
VSDLAVVLLLVAVLAVAAMGTGLARRYALARDVLDVPNERSSHVEPTPRGGGVAIVAGFLAGVAALLILGRVERDIAVALIGAGVLVAVTGFLDDHAHIPARYRLLAHFAAATWALAWLGGLPPVAMLGATLDAGWAGNALAAIAIVWLLNLYNFMDGIDGIAGVEAVTVCVGAAVLYHSGDIGGAWILPVLLAAAALGFLAWNLPPARIFMGDAGSGFLGVVLGILALQGARLAPALLWSWLILLGAFVVDATVTLLRRLHRREKVYEAHRSHAYQHAARRAGGHRPVIIFVGLINLLWLLPLALAASRGAIDGLPALVIAYAPLVALALRFGAGTR